MKSRTGTGTGSSSPNKRSKETSSSLQSDRDVDDKYSVVIVGCGSVGKSSITLRFVYDEFEESYDPTKADSYRKRLRRSGDGWCEIDILDTAGQEEYAAIRDNYYRSGEGFILVYSVTDRTSFQAVNDFRSQIIRSLNDPHPPLLLLGNKSDLASKRQVSADEGAGLAEKWGRNCGWREGSAKMDEGIETAFRDVIKLIDEKRVVINSSKKMKEKNSKKNRKCTIQ